MCELIQHSTDAARGHSSILTFGKLVEFLLGDPDARGGSRHGGNSLSDLFRHVIRATRLQQSCRAVSVGLERMLHAAYNWGTRKIKPVSVVW